MNTNNMLANIAIHAGSLSTFATVLLVGTVPGKEKIRTCTVLKTAVHYRSIAAFVMGKKYDVKNPLVSEGTQSLAALTFVDDITHPF
jgi:hypothetical protein